MEPFLLITTEIYDSNKIGLIFFLSFSMISYEFPKSGRKRKRKKVNSNGLKLAQVGPRTGESAPAVSSLHRGPWLFEKPLKRPLHYFSVSLTFADRPFPFLFLHKSRSPTTVAEQWLRRACTGRITQRSALRYDRHLIQPLTTITPQLIAKF